MNSYKAFLIFFLIFTVNIFPDTQTELKGSPKDGSVHSSADILTAAPAGIKTISLKLSLIRTGDEKQGKKVAVSPLYYAVESLFNRQYYPYAQIKKAEKTDSSFKVVVSQNPNCTTVTTSENTSSLKISSTLPAVLSPPLVSVIAGDIFYLFAESEKFSFINYSAPPRVSLSVSTDNLAQITGWKQDKLRPLDIAPSSKGILLTLEGGFLTLGNALELTYNTLLDIFYQKENPMPLHPLTASSDLLGNTTVLSRNAESVNFINIDRTQSSRDILKLQKSDNFLYAGLNTGAFAILDETVDSAKTISFYKIPIQETDQPQSQSLTQSSNSADNNTPGKTCIKYPLNSSFISAMASDYDGSLWLYDSIENRIRIIDGRGREIGSLKPVIKPGILMFPQILAVCPDGSFIIGTSGILVKFDKTGIPVWKLKTYKFKGIRSLPAFYRIACSEQDTSLFLLDIQSHRILKFQENSPAANIISVSEDTILYSIKSPSLTPAKFAKAKQKKVALLKEKAGIYYEKQLDFAQAEEFYRQSLADYREIRRKDPVDEEALKEIQKLINARNRVKGEAAIGDTISASLLTHSFFDSSAYSRNSGNTVNFSITNLTDNTVNNIVIRMNIPGFSNAVTESRISQLLPYRSRKITALLSLKRDIARLKTDMEARLNTAIDFTIQNETGEMKLSFPVYFKERNYIRAHTGSTPDFTQFYMPKNRVISELVSSLARYYHEFLYLNGEELKGIALMSVTDALLKEENIKQNGKLQLNKNTPAGDSLYIEDPPLYPVYYLFPEIYADRSALTAVSTGLPGKGGKLSTLIFIASVSANLGFTPSLLVKDGETVLLIDTGIPLGNLNPSARFLKELEAFAMPVPGEGENRETDIIIPIYSTNIEQPDNPGKPDNSTESGTDFTCFSSTIRTITELLEHIHRTGIESYQQFRLIENPVPAVYYGINGENYLPVFLIGESGKDTDLGVLFANIGIGRKIRKK